MSVKTRFAPSPTGHLHIGGVRTAIFSWLYAKRYNGDFFLRIEDTDQKRSSQDYVDSISNSLHWLGLKFVNPIVYQSQNLKRHQDLIKRLLDEDKAYYCYATHEELSQLREQQVAKGLKPKYDNRYRNFRGTPPRTKPVVRFKNPLEGAVEFQDLVKGKILIQNQELDDLVIARSDFSPTYNFSAAIDDMDMGITHIIRGDDHVNNTPRQINILKALGAVVPNYVHLPMVLGSDGARLSKRHNAVSVLEYKKQGYMPESIINYLIRLGWSYQDLEVFDFHDIIKIFDFKNISSSPAIFDLKKFDWNNKQHIKLALPERIFSLIENEFLQQYPKAKSKLSYTLNVITVLKERAQNLYDFISLANYFYNDLILDTKLVIELQSALPILKKIQINLTSISNWQEDEIMACIKTIADQLKLKLGAVAMPFRKAITGVTQTPSIAKVAEILGQEKVINNLNKSIKILKLQQNEYKS